MSARGLYCNPPFAVVLIVVFGLTLVSISNQANYRDNHADTKAHSIEHKASKPEVIENANNKWKTPNCRLPGEHVEADLCQQIRMADAAEKTYQLNVIQVAIGAITLLGLGLTIWLTNKTANAAIGATDKARESVEIARDTFQLSQISAVASNRAFVHYNGMRYTSHQYEPDGRYFWRLRPIWVNLGNTPTRSLRVYTSYIIRDNLIPNDYQFEIPNDAVFHPLTVAPKQHIEGASRDIFGELLNDVRSGKKHLYVWGIARYRDVFPGTPERVTKFCVHADDITGSPLKPWDAEENPMEIRLGSFITHNCTDEDCS